VILLEHAWTAGKLPSSEQQIYYLKHSSKDKSRANAGDELFKILQQCKVEENQPDSMKAAPKPAFGFAIFLTW